jgi:hypothetical protein
MEINAKDLIKIIEMCSKSGVQEIEIGETKIKFGLHFQSFQNSGYNETFETENPQEPQFPIQTQPIEHEKAFQLPIEDSLYLDPSDWERRALEELKDE